MTTAAATGRPTRDNDGYYHMPDGRKLISVTTAIGDGVPKPGPREFLLAHFILQQLADHRSGYGWLLLEEICRQRWTAEVSVP
jgi:hypothetical protein